MGKWYILKGKTPVESNLFEYCAWSVDFNKMIVEKTKIGDIEVSTVFLGLDHSFSPEKTGPILFETMIFGGEAEGYQERYATYEEAEQGHKKACDMVLGMFSIETEILKKVVIKSLN